MYHKNSLIKVQDENVWASRLVGHFSQSDGDVRKGISSSHLSESTRLGFQRHIYVGGTHQPSLTLGDKLLSPSRVYRLEATVSIGTPGGSIGSIRPAQPSQGRSSAQLGLLLVLIFDLSLRRLGAVSNWRSSASSY